VFLILVLDNAMKSVMKNFYRRDAEEKKIFSKDLSFVAR